MKNLLILVMLHASSFVGCMESSEIKVKVATKPKTFCNPLNLNYRFMEIEGGEGIREAADPVVVSFKDRYYLFASKSSGYWYSTDFRNWTHVYISDSVLPIEDYAPGIFVHGGYLYYVGSTHGKGMLYRSASPEKGEWEAVKEIMSFWDPAFYVEGNNLYMYYGCSPVDPIKMQVLDLNTLEAKSEVIDCFNRKKEIRGWERTGEANELPRRPYIEGAWMTQHNGKYYLQYAAPGTEWKSYADGCFVSSSPMGPFTYMSNSPVSYKPTGFIGGAGHGCLFTTKNNSYWKAVTNAISIRHMFERRISFYPAGFDKDGLPFTNTYLGDYPIFLPSDRGTKGVEKKSPGWMLLSKGKPVTASSSIDNCSPNLAVDEESRTAWVAKGNGGSEWLQIDLEEKMQIYSIQVNFDEYGATQKGYSSDLYQRYRLLASRDGKNWSIIVNNSQKRTDMPHDYIEFEKPFLARFIKFENVEYTVSPKVSLRELRVFGKGKGLLPARVQEASSMRDKKDPCSASFSWKPVSNAQGYIIRYGIAPDKLYNNFQISGNKSAYQTNSLNADVTYYFTIDSYNSNGITEGKSVNKILN